MTSFPHFAFWYHGLPSLVLLDVSSADSFGLNFFTGGRPSSDFKGSKKITNDKQTMQTNRVGTKAVSLSEPKKLENIKQKLSILQVVNSRRNKKGKIKLHARREDAIFQNLLHKMIKSTLVYSLQN